MSKDDEVKEGGPAELGAQADGLVTDETAELMSRDLLPVLLAEWGVELSPEMIEELVVTLVELGYDQDESLMFVKSLMHEVVEIAGDMASPGTYMIGEDVEAEVEGTQD